MVLLHQTQEAEGIPFDSTVIRGIHYPLVCGGIKHALCLQSCHIATMAKLCHTETACNGKVSSAIRNIHIVSNQLWTCVIVDEVLYSCVV